MELTIAKAPPGADKNLAATAANHAREALGRLARRVESVTISVREDEQGSGRRVHACSLRLQVRGAADILVETLKPGAEAALATAFAQSRRALLRTPRRLKMPGSVPGKMHVRGAMPTPA